MQKITVFHGQKYEIDANRILANNVILPGEFNPRNVRPWLVISLYGPCGIAWADCMDDAIDEIVDAGLGRAFEVEDDSISDYARCGNDMRACDLTDVRCYALDLNHAINKLLILRFKVARDGSRTLDFD